jgi:methylglutaconyl-CoA hydratase
MPDEPVTLSIDAGVATITMDSQRNRNALTAPMRAALHDAITRACNHPDTTAILLTHNGPVFCAGMDLKETKADVLAGLESLGALIERIEHCAIPVVARLAGPARAGGLGLVAAADIAVSVDTATFAFSEVRLGVVPAMISGVVLDRVSQRAGRELMLTGRTFGAADAAALGLINRAVPAEYLDAAVRCHLDALTLGHRDALVATKALVAQHRSARPAMSEMIGLSHRFFTSPAAAEGMRAFAEKRSPSWARS